MDAEPTDAWHGEVSVFVREADGSVFVGREDGNAVWVKVHERENLGASLVGRKRYYGEAAEEGSG